MNAIAYLEMQLTNINTLFHDIVQDITGEEWLSRAAPGQNRLGFIIWHIPRTQDNVVHLWMRGGHEVFHRPEWLHWQSTRPYGIGTGITLAQADEVATKVSLTDTLLYADVVHNEILAWLRQHFDEALDVVPTVATHLALYPEYQTKGYHIEMSGLYNQPTWNLFMRPCIGHIHRHLGELQLAKAMLRGQSLEEAV
jgi:hypothetical protein